MQKVSVVIPAYNSSDYIERTLESVLGQTLSGIEVIVVDDGSQDSTCEKVESFFAENSREGIRKILLSQQNGGVSVARNKGLLRATGEYVMFFDSDDLMDRECVAELYGKAVATKSDVTFCGFDRTDFFGNITEKYGDHFSYLETPRSGIDVTLSMLRKQILIWTGSGIYKTDFIRNRKLLYQAGLTHGEDQEFTIKALYNARQVASVNKSLVKYFERVGSSVITGKREQIGVNCGEETNGYAF